MFNNRSLQTKIMSVFIFMSVALTFSLGILFYENMVERVKTSKRKEMTTLAIETTNKIERFLFERSADIQVLADSKILTMREVSDEVRRDYLKNVVTAYKTYDEVFVIDNFGNLRMTSEEGKSDEYYINIKDNILSENSYISDFVYFQNENQYFIYFSEIIFDDDGNKVGAVVEKMKFDSILEIIGNVKFGNTGRASFRKLELQESLDDIVGVKVTDKLNEGYLTAIYPIKKYESQSDQWVLVINQSLDEAFAVTKDIEKYFAIVIVISLIILFVLSNIISINITKPIRNLMINMKNIMKGNKIYSESNFTSNEVKNLTSLFDILLEELNFLMQRVLEKSGEVAYIEEIRESMETLFKHIPNGIITIDSKGEITSVNDVAENIMSMPSKELIGKNIRDDWKDNYYEFFSLLEEGLEEDVKFNEKICNIYKSQEDFQIIFSTLRQTDMNGILIGMTVVIQELDEKRKFEENIFRAKKLSELGELSAGVAHEIRNPLASIRGYAQMALREVEENTQAFDDIKVVLSEVDRLDGIVDRFITFTRPDKPVYSNYHINDVIKDVLELLKHEFSDSNIEISCNFDEKDIVSIDAQQLKQVFINLLLNSLQALDGGGNIIISTIRNNNNSIMEIHIEDNGEGIDEKNLEKVFTPFFTTRNDGTGLGLAICSRIIEQHGGIIEIDSILGMGTRFIVKLPISKRGELTI